ncbi:hypothetical protein [Streptomyces sp. JB150]|uniref:hypothetical protein n=1 Tax=Streptomyces sp. JB150 TaxID=2714844 RepID=UPI0014077922|nr:hypothetical protein [Streptomyces sp. JB150]QIJ65551.1 hypothetical protein G7Z13_28625 [Streptomyces sp. JB150]
MTVDQLPYAVREFADRLAGLLARLDRDGGWCAVFRRRDPDGMRACLDGREVPPWDVVESLLQDLAAAHGPGAADAERDRTRALHSAALAAYDARPGGRDALTARLDVTLREREHAAERLAGLGRALASATTQAAADTLRLDLAWARDDLARATARCVELNTRLTALDHHTPTPRTVPPPRPAADPSPELAEAPANARSATTPTTHPTDREEAANDGPWPGGGQNGGSRTGGRSSGDRWPGDGQGGGPRMGGGPSGDRWPGDGQAGRLGPSDGQGGRYGHEGGPGGPLRPADGPGGRLRGDLDSGGVPAPGGGAVAVPAPVTPPPAGPAPAAPASTPAPTPKQRKRRRGGARFAGVQDEGEGPVVVPPVAQPVPAAPVAPGGRTPRGARFAGAAAQAQGPQAPRSAPVDAQARRETGTVIATLARLRAEGRSGEAHALLAEAARWPAARFPLLAEELQRAGLAADWATLLWETASLPADRLVAAADALTAAGRGADGRQILRQGVVRPAAEIGQAVLALTADGRGREADALLDAYVRARPPEEVVRSAAPDPRILVPLLLQAAARVSAARHRDLAHALRVAGPAG